MTDPSAGLPVPDLLSNSAGYCEALAVADAVLYEGYVLYPYRKSSGKNRMRWQFGVLAPRGWIEARGPVADGVAGSAESWWQQTECLVEAADSAYIQVRVRFLQIQARTLEERGADGGFHPVDRLPTSTGAELAFDEAVPRETDVVVRLADLLAADRSYDVAAPGDQQTEMVTDRGAELGRVVRTAVPLRGRLGLSAERASAPFPLVRLRVRLENAVEDVLPDRPRDEALRHALIASHCLVAAGEGAFLSLLDPPAWAEQAARECRNVRAYPVLAGSDGDTDLVLSAPIILYDHPRVAPESPGDLHDATEIDEILSLRTLTLTEEEKQEARDTDPRVAAIVDRVDSMPPEVMERLHGAVRSLRSVTRRRDRDLEEQAWWKPGADDALSPGTDSVVIDGVAVARGSRVRLDPRRRGSDAHDMFLAGRTARVESVLLDVDGGWQLAVTIEDDPSADLHQWYGRFHYFRPEELHPVDPGAPG